MKTQKPHASHTHARTHTRLAYKKLKSKVYFSSVNYIINLSEYISKLTAELNIYRKRVRQPDRQKGRETSNVRCAYLSPKHLPFTASSVSWRLTIANGGMSVAETYG